MKIIYCVAGLFNSGGMERIITAKANYLACKGYKVIIITTEQKGRESFFSLHESIKIIDLDINYSDDVNKNILCKTILFLQRRHKHRKILEECIISLSPDIVISTFGTESQFLYKFKDKSKKILEIHFSKYFRYQYDRKGLWRLVDIFRSHQDAKLIPHYDKFVVLTNEDKEYWGNYTNIVAIPNFITSIPHSTAVLNNKICLAVGRISYQKGFDLLVKIWSIVNKKHPDWELWIYGSGELQDALELLISKLQLTKTIKIFSPTKQIGGIYLQGSILLMSSRYEGLPMVLLEAHSYGLPVVSFECKCGPKDVIQDGINGFLIPNNNLELFADKIMLLIENQSMREQMGKAAYQSSLQYTEEKIMSKWMDLFNQCMNIEVIK